MRSHTDLFKVHNPSPLTMGEIASDVFFNGQQMKYTYVHTVTPSLDLNSMFRFLFSVPDSRGTLVAGWSFSYCALRAGGTGTDSDAGIDHDICCFGESLNWFVNFHWDALEPIAFFFATDLRPGGVTKGYTLGLVTGEGGTASSLAPIPEPGSIALLGSGLVGLYAAVRRRRSPKE